MKPSEQPILVERTGAILTLTLNRPAVLNAIDLAMAVALHAAVVRASIDPQVRAVVITGAGRGFCAGGDLHFAVAANPERPGDSFLALTKILHETIEEMRTMSKPVIAAINGPAAGAGLFLALACDLRVMAASAYLKQSNTSYGLSIPAGGSFTLPRLVGMARALEIALLDEPIEAPRALEWGLVNTVVADEALPVEAQHLAQRLASRFTETLGRVKRLFNASFANPLHEQLAFERQMIAASANSPEGWEGLRAFITKRPPNTLPPNVLQSNILQFAQQPAHAPLPAEWQQLGAAAISGCYPA
jgi:2-(1,2-epoxy-1,2-dihydrophenyl)acetyl-CoA isomerase